MQPRFAERANGNGRRDWRRARRDPNFNQRRDQKRDNAEFAGGGLKAKPRKLNVFKALNGARRSGLNGRPAVYETAFSREGRWRFPGNDE